MKKNTVSATINVFHFEVILFTNTSPCIKDLLSTNLIVWQYFRLLFLCLNIFNLIFDLGGMYVIDESSNWSGNSKRYIWPIEQKKDI